MVENNLSPPYETTVDHSVHASAVVKKNAELTKEKNLRAKVTSICILYINLNFLIGEDYILH